MAARTSLRRAVDGVFVAIGDGLANGEEARTAGNSGPSAREADRPLRGRKPRTGEVVSVSVSTSPTFKAGKALRDAVKAGPGIRTLQGQPTATRSASDSLIMEPARLLYDDGHSASFQCAAGKTQESRGVDGWSATSLDSSSRRRQEDRGSSSNRIWDGRRCRGWESGIQADETGSADARLLGYRGASDGNASL